MYNKKTHIHFMGIGGIGMSGIAKILKNLGYIISGCDLDLTQKSVVDLLALGCRISQGNNTDSCKDYSIDILVYSSAIKNNNPEIIAAQEREIPTITRALMLAELMRSKYSIVIGGSHGKTTTTSMIAHILIEAKKDPTVIVGGHIKNISTNARIGNGDFLVAEADESDKSLLKLFPTLAVLTNIDLEHLDVYKGIEDIKATFHEFLSNVPFYGKAFVCADDLHIRELLPNLHHIKVVKYGIETDADFHATHINLLPMKSTYQLLIKTTNQKINVAIPMPGRHNILNSLASISIAHELGIDLKTITTALESFGGVERRFSYSGLYKNVEIFDDYGHHPTEIFYTLQVAKKRAQKKLIVLFQPHRYSRTHQLWSDFISTFLQAEIDTLIITDIYPASEAPIPEITSKQLVSAIQQQTPSFQVEYIQYNPNLEAIQNRIDELIEPGDLLLLLGAGKINKLAQKLIKQ